MHMFVVITSGNYKPIENAGWTRQTQETNKPMAESIYNHGLVVQG
jgi:hypothetical protein